MSQIFQPVSDTKLTYKEVQFVIPANGTLPVAIQFQQMKVIACSDDAALVASIGYSTDSIRLAVGLGYGVTSREMDEGGFYNSMTIRNVTGAPVTLSIAFAFGNITDDRVTIGGSVAAGILADRNDSLVLTRAAANDALGNLSMDDKGALYTRETARTFTTGQVTVTTTAISIIATGAANSGFVIEAGTLDLYIGAAGVTTTTGFLVRAGQSFSGNTHAAIFGIRASGSAAVSFYRESN